MPIYLIANEAYNPKGPDGMGRNRLRVDTIDPSGQCALKPKTYAALRECQNTVFATYGQYESCIKNGNCNDCPIYNGAYESKAVTPIHSDEFYVRELKGEPHSVNKFQKGWRSTSFWGYSWADLNLNPEFYPAEFGSDEHSRWVLMKRKSIPDFEDSRAELPELPEGVRG